jgi:AcrR family transcriptional regulator
MSGSRETEQSGPGQTQRQRILAGLISCLARQEYAATTVAHIIARAGVSRPTFYEFFADKEDCLVQAIADTAETLCARAALDISSAGGTSSVYASVAALLEFCRASANPARLLTTASLEAGPAALDERDRWILTIAKMVDDRDGEGPGDGRVPDLDSGILLGGVSRLIATRLRQGRALDERFRSELLAWIESYEAAPGERVWHSLRSSSAHTALQPIVDPPLGYAPVGGGARSRPRDVGRDRQQLLFTAAELLREKGFAATTATEVAKRAGIGSRHFSRLFSDKREVLLELFQLGSRRTLAATAAAYFSRASWPERQWRAGEAFISYVGLNPVLPQMGFVEAYSGGARGARQVDHILAAFTLFLREGDLLLAPGAYRPTRTAREAIAAYNFELFYREARRGPRADFASLLAQPQLCTLTPFLGHARAIEFIEEQLAARRSQPPRCASLPATNSPARSRPRKGARAM